MMAYSRELQIHFDRRVPMRDGITLSADIYLPDNASRQDIRYPVILSRTPYMKTQINLAVVKYFVRHGYVYVSMDVRGRGDSDGEFVPHRNEGDDGYDAVEWCASQPWSDGNVGTIGASYSGYIQWMTAIKRPPHLRAMIVLVTPSDPFVETPTGSPGPMHLCWLYLVSGRLLQPIEQVDWERVYQHLPLVEMDQALGRRIDIWHREFEHTQLDEYWQPVSYQHQFDQVDVPVLHISGWYDDEQIGTLLNFVGMTSHAAIPSVRSQQRLLMGPWGHRTNASTQLGALDFGPQALIDMEAEQVRWFDRWLKQVSLPSDAMVRLFVMGRNQWRNEQEWPLARTRWTFYYFHSHGSARSRYGDGLLSLSQPDKEPVDEYLYDPANAVPFITEMTSTQIGGPDDYADVQAREDVLVYTSDVLTNDIEVTGPIKVRLYASSSAPDTDFMAMLLDVWPNGFRQRLCDGMVRARFRNGMEKPELIQPGEVYCYEIDCWNTSQVFKAGHRICVQIASSAFPKYDRNQNIAGALGMSTDMLKAQQAVYHDLHHLSGVMLPIIPDAS